MKLAKNADLLAHCLEQADSGDGQWSQLMSVDWFGAFSPHECPGPHDDLASALSDGWVPAGSVVDEMGTFQLREFVLHCHHEASSGEIVPEEWDRWAEEATDALRGRLMELMFTGQDFQAGSRLAKEWGSLHTRGLGRIKAKRRWRADSNFPAVAGINGIGGIIDWLSQGRNRGVRLVNACAALDAELPSLRAYALDRMAQLAGQRSAPSPAARAMSALSPAPPTNDRGPVFGGRFQIVDKIGEGGQGTVFLARDTWSLTVADDGAAPDSDLCALKVMPVAEGRLEGTFWREAEALRCAPRLQSIPQFIGILRGEHRGREHVGLAEEWIPGPTLSALVEKVRESCWLGVRPRAPGWLPLRWADRWMRDLDAAVDWHRQAGFMHGDIKPDNIVVAPGGLRAVLVDWGGVRELGTPGAHTAGFVHPLGHDSEFQDAYQLALLFSELMAVRPHGETAARALAASLPQQRGGLARDEQQLAEDLRRVRAAPAPWGRRYAPALEAALHEERAPATAPAEPVTGPAEWCLPEVALRFSEPRRPRRRRVRAGRPAGQRARRK